jgi:hypothetical protein
MRSKVKVSVNRNGSSLPTYTNPSLSDLSVKTALNTAAGRVSDRACMRDQSDLGLISDARGRAELAASLSKYISLFQLGEGALDRVGDIVDEAFNSTLDDFKAADAVRWGGNYQIPMSAVAEGEAALAAAGGSLEQLARDRQAEMLPNRLNRERIKAWCRNDNPEIELLTDLVEGIRVMTSRDFQPNGSQVRSPLRALYKRVHSAVDTMIMNTVGEGWAVILTMATASLIVGIHFVAAHWAAKKGKESGRVITDASGGEPGFILNGDEVKEAMDCFYKGIHHPVIEKIIIALCLFKNLHPERSWDELDIWKADVSSAFNRLFWRADCARLFAMELVGGLCVIFLVGTFGYTGTPAAFEVVTRALRFELSYRLLGVLLGVYVDDAMAAAWREDMAADAWTVESLIEGLLGPGAYAHSKYERTDSLNRRLDVLGYTLCLRHLLLTISRRNWLKTAAGFFAVDTSKPVPVNTMEKLSSWAARYSKVCRPLKPFVTTLYGSHSWMENRKATVVLTEEVVAVIWMWRAMLCVLELDERRFARPFKSFLPRDPRAVARFDSSLSGVGILLGWIRNGTSPEWFGGCSLSLTALDFGSDASFQNVAEFIGMNCASIALVLAGMAEEGFILEGDSTSALSWAINEHYRGDRVKNASIVHTALGLEKGVAYVGSNHIPGKDDGTDATNGKCDALSRGRSLEQIGLGHITNYNLEAIPAVRTLISCCDPRNTREDETSFARLWNDVFTAVRLL